MDKFYVKDVVCDYGIFDDRDNLRHTMILNSNRNAQLIASVMNSDEEHKIFEVVEVERLKQDLEQHIKWNKAHTKARVELSEEVERLKYENEGLSESVRLLSDEYNRRLELQEALKECNPINIIAYADLEANCQFCKVKVIETQKLGQWELNIEHAPDCKYMNSCK